MKRTPPESTRTDPLFPSTTLFRLGRSVASERSHKMSVAENLRGPGTPTATVRIDGERYDLPIRKGTLGPDVLDINSFYQETGCFTYDPGYTSDRKSTRLNSSH